MMIAGAIPSAHQQAYSACMSSSPSPVPQAPSRWRPLLAATLSGLFPGLGQLYNGERIKALLFFAVGALMALGPLNPLEVDIDLEDLPASLGWLLLASLPFLVIAMWSVVDAYRVARSR
ncbi:MAG: hypothetical protein HY270_10655 [Deltaproteobacteria bacterium]|nr:hypothetical protein [Deltaproteobacteria bacterium]